MNYYLDALLQLHIDKLKELKSIGRDSIKIDIVIKLLANAQKINKDEIPSIDFNLESDSEK